MGDADGQPDTPPPRQTDGRTAPGPLQTKEKIPRRFSTSPTGASRRGGRQKPGDPLRERGDSGVAAGPVLTMDRGRPPPAAPPEAAAASRGPLPAACPASPRPPSPAEMPRPSVPLRGADLRHLSLRFTAPSAQLRQHKAGGRAGRPLPSAGPPAPHSPEPAGSGTRPPLRSPGPSRWKSPPPGTG